MPHVNGRRRIVLVDDDAGYVSALGALLAYEAGLEVVGTAWNGRQALDVAMRLSPDIVIMDVDMPIMDGISATRALRDAVPNAIIVLVSGEEDERAGEGRAAGAAAFLAKSAVPTQLVDALAELAPA